MQNHLISIFRHDTKNHIVVFIIPVFTFVRNFVSIIISNHKHQISVFVIFVFLLIFNVILSVISYHKGQTVIFVIFVFVFAILGVTSKKENGAVAGIVIGLTLTLVHILGISFTGTSVNPARSFGPAILLGGDALSCVWVFIVAPLVGGVLAALVYKFLAGKKAE